MELLTSLPVKRPTVLAVCPGYKLLAAATAARGDKGEGSRIDVVELWSGDKEQAIGKTLKSVVAVPSSAYNGDFHRLAWSGSDDAHPVGLIAGGLDGGSICIWDPSKLRIGANEVVAEMSWFEQGADPCAETLRDIKCGCLASEKTIMEMQPQVDSIIKEHVRKQKNREENAVLVNRNEAEVNGDSDWEGWVLPQKEDDESSGFVLKLNNPTGPVLGLAFNNQRPCLLAGAASGEKLSIYHLDRAFGKSETPCELTSRGSTNSDARITSLEWHPIYPAILASTSDAGVTKIWDLRQNSPKSIHTCSEVLCNTEVHWNPMDPVMFAVSSNDSYASSTVRIWDARNSHAIKHEFGTAKGVASFSWCTSGKILTTNVDGSLDSWKITGDGTKVRRPLCASGVHEARCLSDNTIAVSFSHSVDIYRVPKDGCTWPRRQK